MRALFWLLSLSALAIGIALLGRVSDGYVLAVMPPWRVELSFNLFIVSLLALLLLSYLLLRLLINTLNLPQVVAQYRARRTATRAAQAATDALRLFWEGRYVRAAQQAERVGDAGDSAGIATLVGLKAAHALRDEGRIAAWRQHATAMTGAWRTAWLMAEIRIALDARDFPAAREALEQLGPQERRQIAAQRLALRLAQGQGDWAEMLRLARQLEKHKALTAEQARPLRLRAQRGMIDTLRDEPVSLMRYWQSLPAGDRLDAQSARQAAQALAAAGACTECARLVEEHLDDSWEPVLLEIYAGCEEGDLLGRIAHCEKWLLEHPQDAALLLALGRLCVRRQLWGKAQSYFEASLAVTPSCAAHIELARLCDQLDRADDANRHYRAAANCQDQLSQSRGGRKSV